MNLRHLFIATPLCPALASAACPSDLPDADLWQQAHRYHQQGSRACALRLYEVYADRTSDPLQKVEARRRIDDLREKVGVLQLVDPLSEADRDAKRTETPREIKATLAGQELVRSTGLRFYYDDPGLTSATLLLFEEPSRGQVYQRLHSEADFHPAHGRTTQLRYAPIEKSKERFATGMGLAYLRHLAGSRRFQPLLLWTINLEHRWQVADTRSSMDLLIQLPVTFASSATGGVYGGAGLALGARGVIHLPNPWGLKHDLAPVFLISYQLLRQPADSMDPVDQADKIPICTVNVCINPALRAHFLLSYAIRPLSHQELRLELGVDFGVLANQLYPPHLSIGLSHLWRFPRE